MLRLLVSHGLGLVGAVLGGVLGHRIFVWLYQQGFYGLMIPGALLGLGCNLFSSRPSKARGVACGIAGVVLGLYSQYVFQGTKTFGYLVAHVYELTPITLIMIAAGGGFAFWLGKDAGAWFGSMGTVSRKSHSSTHLD